MKMAPIASLLAFAAIVAVLAPYLPSRDVEGSPSPEAPEKTTRLAVSRSDQWFSGQTVLERQSDGHFYTQASVEGAQVRFLVDTGASIVALTGDAARDIGLTWDPAALRPIGRGASGTVEGIPIHLDRVEINGLEARDVQAAIIPEGLDISLLGQSYLSRIEKVEISENEMRLGG